MIIQIKGLCVCVWGGGGGGSRERVQGKGHMANGYTEGNNFCEFLLVSHDNPSKQGSPLQGNHLCFWSRFFALRVDPT